MKPSFWKYENNTFRGRVVVYAGNVVTNVPCTEVRKNQLKALEDAKKLLRTLKKQHVDNRTLTPCGV